MEVLDILDNNMQRNVRFKTTIASPPYREGLVVILSIEYDAFSADLAEYYYSNNRIMVEIFQNGQEVFCTNFDSFKAALDEAEDKIRNKITPY